MTTDLRAVTADIVSAHVGHNTVAQSDMPVLIASVFRALRAASSLGEADQMKLTPAVTVRASVTPDYLISLESGRKVQMLKRYLRTNYDMTPGDYRAKWGLPHDYPMVAANYAKRRKEIAIETGLGHTGRKRPTP